MSIEEKVAKIINLNLFSGSADVFRTAMGGYFEIVDVETTDNISFTTGQEVEQQEFVNVTPQSPFVDWVWSPDPTEENTSPSVLVPTYRYPIRSKALYDTYESDALWKTYWIGGTYKDIVYPGIYNETVWEDDWFEFAFPYTQMEANLLADKEQVTNIAETTCTYNYYLPEYQNYVNNLESELLIPNMYLIEMFNGVTFGNAESSEGLMSESEDGEKLFNKTMQDFVSLDGLYDSGDGTSEVGSINGLLTDADVDWGEQLPNYALHGYLSQSVPLTNLSASTTAYVKNALQNIFFDDHSTAPWRSGPDISLAGGGGIPTFTNVRDNDQIFPYYIDIAFEDRNFQPGQELPVEEIGDNLYDSLPWIVYMGVVPSLYAYNTHFYESLAYNNYSSKFLKSLKEIFNNEVDSVTPTSQDYVISQDYQSSSIDATTDDQVLKVDTTSIRSIDYLKLLNYSHKNYKSTTDNCYFVGERLISREAAMDTTGAYRYLNSKQGAHVIEDTIALLANEDIAPSFSSATDLLAGWRDNGKYNETIAYRIEKIGGTPTGDAQEQNVLQNFWIFNSVDLAALGVDLRDTQVKYGQNYTYNIYAYVITVGIRYKFSDLRLTRQINYNEDTGDYCLEFYNPTTDEPAEQLTQYYVEEGLSATLDTTDDKGKADFYVNYEPTIKLFEIPMASKTLKVLDNPANQLLINPFQLLDASQTVGYTVEYERFIEQPYPKTISSANITSKQDYLNAKDLLEGENLTEAPVARQRYLEIYRLSEKPKTFSDFDNNLVSTIDLKLEDSKFTLPSAIFYDMIKTNQKYYYLFRALSENRMPGQLSEIYEAELINDGGYTYSNFDILFEEDLEEEIFVDPTLAFKKLIQLQPNMSQIVFNDVAVDYTDTAASQMGAMALGDADDLIWGKTFKIRLTSKKTGKKMDLNVTYKYETESN